MSVRASFQPAWWLRHRHAQTIWPALIRRRPRLSLRRERIKLPDGDFLDLDWTTNSTGPIVLLFHGLGGSINSNYVRGLLNKIQHRGWRGVLMHFRSASGEVNLSPKSYHAGESEDTRYIIDLLKKREPETKIGVCGFSIGGSALLNLLAKYPTCPVETAVAVSVPFLLDDAANTLDKGFAQLYQNHILRCLKTITKEKFTKLKSPFDLPALSRVKNFRQFDDMVTAPLHGFDGVDDYYYKCSAMDKLPNISTPTLIIQSTDDPFISQRSIPKLDSLSPKVKIELHKNGGHVGFVAGAIPWKPIYWLEQRIPQYLQDFLD